jgi:hypothetical protein
VSVQTRNLNLKATLWTALCVACMAPAPSVAQSNARDMGCAPTVANPCTGGSSSRRADPGDDGAARRAQEAEAASAAAAAAERQRRAEADRLERARVAEEKRRKDAEFIRNRDAAASTLRGSSGSAMDQLRGAAGTDGSGLSGSGFDSDGSGARLRDAKPQPALARAVPNTDPSVVDARVPRDGAYLTNQVPELARSPAADRITKGFQAVTKRDWPVALAWWQEALHRDPDNAALKRSVTLAQWMVDRRKAEAAGRLTPLGVAFHTAKRGEHALAIRQFELAKADNPAIGPLADHMIAGLRQKQAKAVTAAYWNREIEKGTRQLVDQLRETGMNMLTIGEEKHAQDMFMDADFYSMGLSTR